MPTVRITATNINDLTHKLQGVKDYIEFRRSMGFPMFQTDEEWHYITQPDKSRVCPICLEYAMLARYQGFDIPRFFPSNRRIVDDNEIQVVWPNVHEDHPEVHGLCHCSLTWLHPIETLTDRAVRDLEEMIKYG